MSERRSIVGPILLGVGGLATAGGIVFAVVRSRGVVQEIEKQVDAPSVPLPPSQETVAKLPTFTARLTGYWPFKPNLTPEQRKMEGGTKDRIGKPLIAIEDHLRDPVKFPYVSVAGDQNIFPYGQRLIIDAWPNAIFRVVDTGGNFFGVKKVYRITGAEPLDICQLSSDFKKPTTATVKIVPGDNFASTLKKGTVREVVTSGLKDQTVRLTGDVQEGRTTGDYEALARAVESELGGRPREEQLAGAWAIRNRAADLGCSVEALLSPRGEFGSSQKSGGYASTRKVPTQASRTVADEVLGASDDEDSTYGATEFWLPLEQERLRQLGDVHRAARAKGDAKKAEAYARYDRYGSEGEVRNRFARDGYCVVCVVGEVELLGRMR